MARKDQPESSSLGSRTERPHHADGWFRERVEQSKDVDPRDYEGYQVGSGEGRRKS